MKRSLSILEVSIIVVGAVLLIVTVVSVVLGAHVALPITCIVVVVVLLMILLRISVNPDRLRARQSERTLKLAARTLPYMQKGLSEESAQEVCKLLLPATGASAVAITSTEKILGYFGREMNLHKVGSPISTAATRKTIEEGKMQVMRTNDGIGNTNRVGSMEGAVSVPLKQHDEVVGVLKFYYKTARQIDENQLAMAEGLGGLLEMQLRLAELEYQRELAVKMNLKALQAQINPHFLFNTINTIAALIRTDPAQARILLREFGVFYRQTLDNSMAETTLDVEITQTLRYLGFEKARFGAENILVEVEKDEALDSIIVPTFIIQPIVENAVAHGRREGVPLNILIKVCVEKGNVFIKVSDDGVGMAESTQERALSENRAHAGVALKNVAERLEGYFGNNAKLTVQSEINVGTTIILNLGPRDLCKVITYD